MDNMRFGGGNPMPQMQEVRPNRGNGFKNILAVLVLLLVLAGLAWFGYSRVGGGMSNYNDPTASPYHAVFLSNGQVYFGKILENNQNEIVLGEVYYLQLSNQATATTSTSAEAKFALVKLGQELHGPTDKLFVNRDHVMFVEQLKNDSKVVASITKGI